MPRLAFYKQVRQDGGIRTGIELDGNHVLGRFEQGQGDEDPILAWYVDIEVQGAALPDDAESVRSWLRTRSEPIRRILLKLADELRAGVDLANWPILREWRDAGSNVQILVRVSANRRTSTRALGQNLSELAEEWPTPIAELPEIEPAIR